MRGRFLAGVAALALAGCGREAAIKGATRPDPTPSPKATATPSASDLNKALRLAAISEEEYFTDNGTYTTDLRALAASNLDIPPGVAVKVVSANATGYCLAATALGVTLYYDSDTGRPQTTSCR